MKFSFKKLALVIILSASIPLFSLYKNLIIESLFLATSNLNTQCTTEIKNKLDTINKNKNDIDELSLEIKSKKNDLSMAASTIGYNDSNSINSEIEELKLDENNMKNLLLQFDDILTNIKTHRENKDYPTLLNDMNSLISLQKSKYTLLQKVNLDLDIALGALK